MPTEELLHHGSLRLVYGVRLVENVREYLLGMEKPAALSVAIEEPGGDTHAKV